MPRKKRTRAAPQPVKQEPELATKGTSPDDQSRDGATAGPVLSDTIVYSLRNRTVAVSEGAKQSSAKASKAKEPTAKGKKARTKGKKIASKGVSRKRTKKVAANASGTYICRVATFSEVWQCVT